MDTMTGKTPTTVTELSNELIPFDFLRSTVKTLGGKSPRWSKNYYEFHGYTWTSSFEGIGGQRFELTYRMPYDACGQRVVQIAYGNQMTFSHPLDAIAGAQLIAESLRG